MKMVQRAFALVSLSVLLLGLSGPGCQQEQAECDPNTIVIDNRDRLSVPDLDYDWICTGLPLKGPKPPPPVYEPDISGTWPLDVGPKDPDAVVKMAILIHTCLPSIPVESSTLQRLNWTIDLVYFEYLRDAIRQAMYSRSECFKDKFNGCDALRECYGVVQERISQPGADSDPPYALPTPGCADGVRRESFTYRYADEDKAEFVNTWVNCKGLGLECYDNELRSWCTSVRTPCEPEETVSSCLDGRIYRCPERIFEGAPYNYYFEMPRCSDFGLSCEEKNGSPGWTPNSSWSHCIGTGAECFDDPNDYFTSNSAIFSYRKGIACESDTVLRACVGRGEKLVDCSQLGKGFKCLPGEVPHCGFAEECTQDTPVTCDGDSIVVCDAGRIRKVDCKTLGFTTCDEAHSACGPNNLF